MKLLLDTHTFIHYLSSFFYLARHRSREALFYRFSRLRSPG